jgi:hypothetical protein
MPKAICVLKTSICAFLDEGSWKMEKQAFTFRIRFCQVNHTEIQSVSQAKFHKTLYVKPT